jgi:hypothetical protein
MTNQDRFSIISPSVQLRISFGLILSFQLGFSNKSGSVQLPLDLALDHFRISFGSALDYLLSPQPMFGNKLESVQLRITFS